MPAFCPLLLYLWKKRLKALSAALHLKGVLNTNFRLLSFKQKNKLDFLKINFDLGFRVL